MKRIISLLVLVFVFLDSFSQMDISIRRKEFKTGKEGFSEAWGHINEGDKYFEMKGVWFGKAYDEYLKAFLYNNSNAELNYKIGASALFSDRKEEAAEFLLKAMELKSSVSTDVTLLAARALQYQERYQEAIDMFNKYLDSHVRKSSDLVKLAKKCIDDCTSALTITRDTVRIEIENLGKGINTDADEYSEVISSDGRQMYFASRRKQPHVTRRYSDTKYDENIFVSSFNNTEWDSAVIAGRNINTTFCEAPVFLATAGDRLYLYKGSENKGDIMVSEKRRNSWKEPQPVSFPVNSNNMETSFCIAPSGDEIYFVTTGGKGNFGGKDIYFIKRKGKHRWSSPENAGKGINTPLDEESVRFSVTGDTMWFSSQGHNSIGGFDIFYSTRDSEGKWSEAVNAGYPLNTPWDDMFYLPSPVNSDMFYFASNRKGGLGGLDIYSGRIIHKTPSVSLPDTNVIATADTSKKVADKLSDSTRVIRLPLQENQKDSTFIAPPEKTNPPVRDVSFPQVSTDIQEPKK